MDFVDKYGDVVSKRFTKRFIDSVRIGQDRSESANFRFIIEDFELGIDPVFLRSEAKQQVVDAQDEIQYGD